MGFSRQEYWSGLPFPFPVDLPNPGIEPGPPALQADSLPFELPRSPIMLQRFLQNLSIPVRRSHLLHIPLMCLRPDPVHPLTLSATTLFQTCWTFCYPDTLCLRLFVQALPTAWKIPSQDPGMAGSLARWPSHKCLLPCYIIYSTLSLSYYFYCFSLFRESTFISRLFVPLHVFPCLSSFSRAGKVLWLKWILPIFCKLSFIGIQPCPFVYIFLVAALAL